MSLTVAQLVARLTADTSGFYRGMAVANASMIRSGGIISRVSAGAGIAVAAIGITSLVSAGNFQQSMNIVQAVSGATSGQMKALSDKAVELGNDFKLPNVSAKDAADAMVELAKGGFSTAQILGSVKDVLRLGLAANLNFADSAQIVARTLKNFNLPASEAKKVVDLLAAGANKSTAEIGDLANGLQNAGGQFSSAKIPVDQLVTALTILTDRGLDGELAGTALKVMLQRLENPTKKAAQELDKLGVKVYDAHGKMTPFPRILKMFSDGLKGASDKTREQALNVIFGSRANQAMIKLIQGGPAAWDKYSKAVNQSGTAQKIVEARTKGFNGAMQALGSAVETAAIKLGTPMLNAAEKAARGMANFIANLNYDKIISFFGAIKDGIVWLIQWADKVGILKPLLVGVGAALGAFLILSLITTLIEGVTGAFAALTAVMMANPFVAIAAILIGLGAALVYLYRTNETFRNAVNSAWNSIKAIVIPIIHAIAAAFMNVFGPLFEQAGRIWNGIKQIIKGALDVIIGLVKFFKSVFTGDWQGAWDAIKQIAGGVWGIIKGYVQVGIAAIIVLAKTIAAPFILAWKGIEKAASTTWDAISKAASSAWSGIKGLLQRAWDGIVRGALTFARDTLSAMVSAFGWTGQMDGVEAAKQRLDRILDGMDQKQKGVFGRLSSSVSDTMTTVAARVASAGVQVATIGKNFGKAGDNAAKAVQPGITKFGNLFKKLPGVVTSVGNTVAADATSVGAAVGAGVVGGFNVGAVASQLAGKIIAAIRSAVATARANTGSTTEEYTARMLGVPAAQGIADGFIQGVSGLANTISTSIRSAFQMKEGEIRTIFQLLGVAGGKGIITGFLLGTADLPSNVSASLQKALEAGKAKIDEYMGKYQQAFGHLTDIVGSAFDAITEQTKTKSEKILDKLISKHDAEEFKARLDKAVADLKAAQDAVNSMGGMSDADFAAKYGLDPNDTAAIQAKKQELLDALSTAQKTYDDLAYQQQVAALQKQADEERKQYNARRTMQKQHLMDRLNDLEAALAKHPEREKYYQEKIIKLLGAYGINYRTVGKALGVAFANGLEEALTNIEAAIKKIAAIIQKYLEIKSPTELGPLSTLDHWWDNFAPTLLEGLDPLPIETAIAKMSNPGAIGPPSASGGDTYISVQVDRAIGSDLEQAGIELAEPIRREFLRMGRR